MTQPDLPAFLLARSGNAETSSHTKVTSSKPEPTLVGRLVKLLVRSTVALAFLGVIGGGWAFRSKLFRQENPTLRLPMASVAKADLSSVINTWGRIESSQNTIISCELERLEVFNAGKVMTSGGATTILELVEEGKQVKAGEVLCLLDGSDYEELVRTQEIKTLQAEAALRQAQLNFEVAEIAVKEYSEGIFRQDLQSLNGLIFLARSDLERAQDRLQWTEKMLEKGYLPIAKKAEATQTKDQFEFDLQSYLYDRENYVKFRNNRTKMELDSEVEKRRFEVIANTQRVTRNRERLAHYRQMVEFCTIRAPHDGILIYAVDPSRPGAMPLEPGQTVRQSQKLFFLPDLSKMQVLAYLHESVASRVHEGMKARAKIEGLANRTFEGRVISVAPLPTTAGNWISDEVKYFVSIVKLDGVPQEIRPGMSAEIEFDIDRCEDVLAVPSEAIAFEQGRNFCYVAGVDGLERRAVSLGRSNRDLLEVKKGLAEGEQVVLRPEKIDAIESMIVAHTDKEPAAEEATSTVEQPVPPTGSGTSAGPAPITVE